MKTLCLLVLLITSFSLFAEPSSEKLESFYKMKLHEETDFLRGIKIADGYINDLEFASDKSSEDYFLLSLLYRDRLILESHQVIRIDKKLSKKEWFSSNYFRLQYRKISSYMNRSIQESKKKNGRLSYKELTAIIANPFVQADLKEQAHKYSLEILQPSDLGSGEHPLTKDQYVGRIYSMMISDYCSEGECQVEVKRLLRELAEYSADNKRLSEDLLNKYINQSENASTKSSPKSSKTVTKSEKLNLKEGSTAKAFTTVKPSKVATQSAKINLTEANESSKANPSTKFELVKIADSSDSYFWFIVLLLIVVLVIGVFLYKRR